MPRRKKGSITDAYRNPKAPVNPKLPMYDPDSPAARSASYNQPLRGRSGRVASGEEIRSALRRTGSRGREARIRDPLTNRTWEPHSDRVNRQLRNRTIDAPIRGGLHFQETLSREQKVRRGQQSKAIRVSTDRVTRKEARKKSPAQWAKSHSSGDKTTAFEGERAYRKDLHEDSVKHSSRPPTRITNVTGLSERTREHNAAVRRESKTSRIAKGLSRAASRAGKLGRGAGVLGIFSLYHQYKKEMEQKHKKKRGL